MKESTLYNETGNAEKYTPSIESIKKSLNKIHFTNEELAQNLINKTQNLLNNSYNIIKNNSKGLSNYNFIDRSPPNNDKVSGSTLDFFSSKNYESSKITVIARCL